MMDAYYTTAAAPTLNLRREFARQGQHMDAPEFLPAGSTDDGMSTPMIAREDGCFEIDVFRDY